MPSITPFGGISLLAHVIINVVVSSYRLIRSLFRKLIRVSKNNAAVQTVHAVSRRPNASFGRKMFAYSIVGSMFVFFIGTAMLILSFTTSGAMYHMAVNTVSIVISKNYALADVIYKSTSTSARELINSTEKNQTETPPMDTEDSIVDILTASGYSDNSLVTRAFLASELQVVKTPEEYRGTSEQNKKLISAFRKAFENSLNFSFNTTTMSFN